MKPSPLIIKKTIKALPQQVFAAWCEPEFLEQWLKPDAKWKAISRNNFTLGGDYHHDMIANDGTTYSHVGKYKEMIPNKKLVFTWNSNVVKDTLVTIDLKEVGQETEITLTHDLFPDDAAKEQHSEGWNGCLDNLSSVCNKS